MLEPEAKVLTVVAADRNSPFLSSGFAVSNRLEKVRPDTGNLTKHDSWALVSDLDSGFRQ
jgi:hypothetical protein